MSIEPLMSDINLSVLNSNRKSASECCQICFLSLDYDRFVYVEPCNHKFCENCLKSYIEFRISERKVYPIECPTYTCDNKDIDLMIINVIDDKLYYKYQLFRRNAILDTNPNTR